VIALQWRRLQVRGMKNLQAEVEQSIETLVARLQRAVGEAAIEALEQRLVQRPRATAKRRSGAPHRSPAEIMSLAEQLYEAICAQPGERMMELSKVVGQRSEALSLPVSKLLKTGRVRKAGNHQYTRYYPVGRQATAKGKASRKSAG
jgi:hypothetical protein